MLYWQANNLIGSVIDVVMDKPWSNLVAPWVYQPRSKAFSHRDLEKPWEGG